MDDHRGNLDRFRSEFDDLLERFGLDRDWFGAWFGAANQSAARPAIESCVEDGKFIVRTDLPGIDPKDIEIKVVGEVLTVKGSREEKQETKKADFLQARDPLRRLRARDHGYPRESRRTI